MIKSYTLNLAEKNNYLLVQLHGVEIPVFWLIPPENSNNIAQIAIVDKHEYQLNRQLTEVEQNIVKHLFIEMRNHQLYDDSHEFKLIMYDFSLDNNE